MTTHNSLHSHHGIVLQNYAAQISACSVLCYEAGLPSPSELLSCTEPTCTQLPGLALHEKGVFEEGVGFTCLLLEHQMEAKQVPVNPTARRGLARRRSVRLYCTPEQLETGSVLRFGVSQEAARRATGERAHVGPRVDHREHPRAAVGRKRADRLGAAVVEEARERSLVRRGEFAARAIPRELQRHLNKAVG